MPCSENVCVYLLLFMIELDVNLNVDSRCACKTKCHSLSCLQFFSPFGHDHSFLFIFTHLISYCASLLAFLLTATSSSPYHPVDRSSFLGRRADTTFASIAPCPACSSDYSTLTTSEIAITFENPTAAEF